MKPLGTGVWNEPRAFAVPALQGGWFAAPDSRGFNAFASRYRARYNADPTRLATLSYDAVSLAAALARTQGSQRFAESVLTNPSGFAGADGVFRLQTRRHQRSCACRTGNPQWQRRNGKRRAKGAFGFGDVDGPVLTPPSFRGRAAE